MYVPLKQRDHFDRQLTGVFEAAGVQTRRQTEGDFGRHVRKFLLDQLVGGERGAELNAVERVPVQGLGFRVKRGFGVTIYDLRLRF